MGSMPAGAPGASTTTLEHICAPAAALQGLSRDNVARQPGPARLGVHSSDVQPTPA
ncbi:Hypothetical protein A7982_05772 [Minicystis rosea]|nr:Hypothetical protein A7982_05772 [Minicystis rosea]